MNVFITGINGFIASHIGNHLSKQGYTVCGSSSRPDGPIVNSRIVNVYPLLLGDPVQGSIFQEVETVIHCAHDFRPGALRKNIEGTIAIAEGALKEGVEKQIFISSLSARVDAITEYGKAKYETERYFLQHMGIVIRPGTVVGDGGVFGRIVGIMKKFPVLPLPGGGKSKMYLIGIVDLCRSISMVLDRKGPSEFNLYYPETPSLRSVLTQMKILLQRKVYVEQQERT